MVEGSSPRSMASLALSSCLCFQHPAIISPLLGHILSSMSESLVTTMVYMPLLHLQICCAMLVISLFHRYHSVIGLLVISLLWKLEQCLKSSPQKGGIQFSFSSGVSWFCLECIMSSTIRIYLFPLRNVQGLYCSMNNKSLRQILGFSINIRKAKPLDLTTVSIQKANPTSRNLQHERDGEMSPPIL